MSVSRQGRWGNEVRCPPSGLPPSFIITATTSGAAHTLHTNPVGSGQVHELFIQLMNATAGSVNWTMEFGQIGAAITMLRAVGANSQAGVFSIMLFPGEQLKCFAASVPSIRMNCYVRKYAFGGL